MATQWSQNVCNCVQLQNHWSAGFCRLSAPGYMDCTDWYVYKTEADAREAMAELQGCED